MSNLLRNGLAIAEVINDDPALANEVALNLSDEALKIIVEKRGGVHLADNEHISFKVALNQLLNQ
jgi:hypothetical protein